MKNIQVAARDKVPGRLAKELGLPACALTETTATASKIEDQAIQSNVGSSKGQNVTLDKPPGLDGGPPGLQT